MGELAACVSEPKVLDHEVGESPEVEECDAHDAQEPGQVMVEEDAPIRAQEGQLLEHQSRGHHDHQGGHERAVGHHREGLVDSDVGDGEPQRVTGMTAFGI